MNQRFIKKEKRKITVYNFIKYFTCIYVTTFKHSFLINIIKQWNIYSISR